MIRLGIMQGRLLPPVNGRLQEFPHERWAEEIALVAKAKFDCIEWIYDCQSENTNPLCTTTGIAHIRELLSQCGVVIRSVCADYFVDRPLVRLGGNERTERLDRLEWLLNQGRQVDIRRVVLPFVDQASIKTFGEAKEVSESLKCILPVAERLGIELHLETTLNPQEFRALLGLVPHHLVKVNYDSGNSASLGYRPTEEFAAYGERIGSVHIKDRKHGEATVPLGDGDTDFSAVFAGLRALDYKGDFILQVARGTPGDEVAWAEKNRTFVENGWLAAS